MKKNYYSGYIEVLIKNISEFDHNKSAKVEKKIKSLKKKITN